MSSSEQSSNRSASEEDVMDVENVQYGVLEPYQDEPLASGSSSTDSEIEQEPQDADGIARRILEERFDRVVTVQTWCTCTRCSDAMLVGSLEFRCCKEVLAAVGKFTFEGLQPTCITEHPHYNILTDRVVLEHVGPLLKGRNGRFMKRRTDVSMNEYLRAVAYRWIIRWIFGFLGWDNSRPLPACVYNEVRVRFPIAAESTGYLPSERRDPE